MLTIGGVKTVNTQLNLTDPALFYPKLSNDAKWYFENLDQNDFSSYEHQSYLIELLANRIDDRSVGGCLDFSRIAQTIEKEVLASKKLRNVTRERAARFSQCVALNAQAKQALKDLRTLGRVPRDTAQRTAAYTAQNAFYMRLCRECIALEQRIYHELSPNVPLFSPYFL